MAITKSDIKFYLTSVEPENEQTLYAQSIGGHAATVTGDSSASLVYPETTLGSSVGLYGSTLSLADYTDLSGMSYVSMHNEIIKTETIASNSVTISDRTLNGLRNSYVSSDIVRGIPVSNIFDNSVSEDGRQYRCLAVKNISSTETAYNVLVYIKQSSRNVNSDIRIAVEMPQNDVLTGTTTSGGTNTTVRDSTLMSLFSDNHFQNAVLRFTSGSNVNQFRTIISYDGSSGVFVLDSSLPFEASAGQDYRVESGPTQRIKSGIVSPVFGTTRVTSLSVASRTNPISIDVSGIRDHGSDMQPDDIFYIWIERKLIKNSSQFDENSIVITLNYSLV
jgi:hypothetical protein